MRRRACAVAGALYFGLICISGLCAGASGDGDFARRVLEGARAEAARQTPYVDGYYRMAYPGGDVPRDKGVCTDLVVRAFRNAGIDLQQHLHEDRVAHPESYPLHIWRDQRADPSIDHRRCQNLAVWFRRHGASLTTGTATAQLALWLPGDVVFYVREGASHPWHVAIVSDKKDTDDMPMIIDSFPPATSESHRLDEFAPIHSHFRLGTLVCPPSER